MHALFALFLAAQFEGWTKDGTTLVWSSTDAKKVKTYTLKNARSGDEKKTTDAPDFAPAAAGDTGANGKVTLTLSPATALEKKKGALGQWSVEESVKATFTVSCNGVKVSESIPYEMAAMYIPTWSATAFWDPSGRRVLIALEEAQARTMRGPAGGGSDTRVIACGPRVEVLATKALEARRDPVADAIEKAGFAVTRLGNAEEARTATKIYAGKDHQAAAQKIAAAIPGGATVEPLTWKPKAEIVVALGDSAK